MNDPEAITLEEAAEILGISREASAPQVERAYAEKQELLEKKIAQAATAALKNKYRAAMDRLKVAREVMEKQDDGCDLPALEISEVVSHAPVSAPAVAAAEPVAAPAATPAPVVPSEPKKSLPWKLIGIGLAAVLAIGAAFYFLRDPATAIYAGDYRKRISYETVVYDYSLSVAKNGDISGTNQVADKSSDPVKITGKVDEKGVITATGDDKSRYIGQIKGDEMELEEQFESTNAVLFSLKKGLDLPTEPPQAEWAGVYHSPSIEYPAGNYEMRFEVAKNGDVTALSRKLTKETGSIFKGRVNTKGKVTATWDLGDGDTVEYSGTVGEDEMILEETLASGDVFHIKLPKGEEESVVVSPYAGFYRNRIVYASVIFDFEFTVSDDGDIEGTSQIADGSQDAVTITGSVNDDGEVTATGSDKTPYTGSIKDDEMEIKEKVKDDVFTFTLHKDKELPEEAPQAAFEGTYKVSGSNVVAVFTIDDEGKVSGTKTNSEGETWLRMSGRVTTKGKFTAEGTEQSSGRVFTYEGTVTESELKVAENVDGQTYNLTIPKS
jgi:hypothetical protein